MDIEEYIEKIVENGKVEDMEELSEMLEETMDIVKDYDKECYDDLMMKLYRMAYGNVLNKEMAEEIVHKMKPYGMRWSIEETNDVQNKYGLDNIRPVDFFIVINSKFNDDKETVDRFTRNPEEELEMYVSLTKNFIMDEDAKQDKVFLYYTEIPQ